MQFCYWPIEQLPGLSKTEAKLLKNQGISTTEDLLLAYPTFEAKKILAAKLKLNIRYLQKWSALADLARLPSVACTYCGLLLHTGVVSVEQLSQTPIHRLSSQILRLQVATTQRQDLIPPPNLIQQWINEAKIFTQN